MLLARRKSIIRLCEFACTAVSGFNVATAQSGLQQLLVSGLSGEPMRLWIQGQVTYLDFWASWCGPCRQSFPWMQQMHLAYNLRGLNVLAISLDHSIEEAKKFIARNPAEFFIGFDPKGSLAKTFDVKQMPTSFILSRMGKLVYEHRGFRINETQVLEQRLLQSLSA